MRFLECEMEVCVKRGEQQQPMHEYKQPSAAHPSGLPQLQYSRLGIAGDVERWDRLS